MSGPSPPSGIDRDAKLLTAARLVTNGALRFTPPFLAPIAGSLGVSVSHIGVALSLGEVSGLLAPTVGSRVDRRSRRSSMIAGLLLVAVMCSLGAVAPGIWVFGVALVGISLAKIVFDAAMGAWVADRTPYDRRARVTGFVETAWAGSYLLLIPVLAVVAWATTWRLSLGLLAVASVMFALLVSRHVRADVPAPHATERPPLQGLGRTIPVFLGLMLLMLAAQSIVVVFGAWLEDDLGLSTAAVGGVAFVIGLGELVASGSTMRVTDRIGKRRSMLIGAALLVPAAVGLAASRDAVLPGIPLLVLVVVGFEFALVSALPLVAELHPEARARGIGIGFGAGTIGRGIGAALGTWLYMRYGMTGSALLAAGSGVGVLVLWGAFARRAELHAIATSARESRSVGSTGCAPPG